MTLKEIYDLKRKYFIDKTIENSKYLVDNFGYSQPIHQISKQANDIIISEVFQYENKFIDRLITVSNSYHPVDYGFEICVYRPTISLQFIDREILFYVLKEQQDIEQSYIYTIAGQLKDTFFEIISGNNWIDKKYS
jgi:hypothetical protein